MCTRQPPWLSGAILCAQLFDHPDPLHDGDLEKDVFITLSESETFWMFDTLSLSVSSESADAAKVNEDNERCAVVAVRPVGLVARARGLR